ncbi:MAG: hypothetical protein ABSG43_00555 [Solirubrobacteraceae bacterium]|jgi:hypothetical protein
MGRRVLGTIVVTAILVVAAFVYVADVLVVEPATVSATVIGRTAHLTLQTMPSWGHAPDPDWVTYMVQDPRGRWRHTTIFKVPAHTLVTVTLYQYDTATGLRNPFLAQVRGTEGGVAAFNGKPMSVIDPDDASHTFTIPDLGVSVPLPGVADNAPNQCSAGPCTPAESHNTITFSFMTPGPGNYRWQCFVPCGAGFIFGNGGPMQTLGWMSGELEVS